MWTDSVLAYLSGALFCQVETQRNLTDNSYKGSFSSVGLSLYLISPFLFSKRSNGTVTLVAFSFKLCLGSCMFNKYLFPTWFVINQYPLYSIIFFQHVSKFFRNIGSTNEGMASHFFLLSLQKPSIYSSSQMCQQIQDVIQGRSSQMSAWNSYKDNSKVSNRPSINWYTFFIKLISMFFSTISRFCCKKPNMNLMNILFLNEMQDLNLMFSLHHQLFILLIDYSNELYINTNNNCTFTFKIKTNMVLNTNKWC